MKPPKISVILPFYNAAKTLSSAIESIANQSFKDFECLLINNNSTDSSNQIALDWAKKDPRFKLLNEKKQGVTYASNRGSSLAKGEYVCRMDADDWSFPNRLLKQNNYLDENAHIGVVSGKVQYQAHHSKTDGFASYVKLINSFQTEEEIAIKRFVESPIINPSAMWRKSIADDLGMYKYGDFTEDYELWLRWLSHGVKMQKIPDKVIKWHDSDTRLTRTNKQYSDKAFYAIKTKYLAIWLKENNSEHPKVAIWGASRISRKRSEIGRAHV